MCVAVRRWSGSPRLCPVDRRKARLLPPVRVVCRLPPPPERVFSGIRARTAARVHWALVALINPLPRVLSVQNPPPPDKAPNRIIYVPPSRLRRVVGRCPGRAAPSSSPSPSSSSRHTLSLLPSAPLPWQVRGRAADQKKSPVWTPCSQKCTRARHTVGRDPHIHTSGTSRSLPTRSHAQTRAGCPPPSLVPACAPPLPPRSLSPPEPLRTSGTNCPSAKGSPAQNSANRRRRSTHTTPHPLSTPRPAPRPSQPPPAKKKNLLLLLLRVRARAGGCSSPPSSSFLGARVVLVVLLVVVLLLRRRPLLPAQKAPPRSAPRAAAMAPPRSGGSGSGSGGDRGEGRAKQRTATARPQRTRTHAQGPRRHPKTRRGAESAPSGNVPWHRH